MSALFDYYPEPSVHAAGYRYLRFGYAGRDYRLPVVSPLDGRGLAIPLLSGFEQIEDAIAPPPPEINPAYQSLYAARLEAAGARLWDDDLYCLTGFAVSNVHANPGVRIGIAKGRFLAYRLTGGLLREEFLEAHKTGRRLFPLRDRIAPDIAAVTDFSHRLTGGGVHMFSAFRRPAPEDDYAILLQRRSSLVSEAGGTYGVVPMAFHQPPRQSCAPLDPRSPGATGLRELYEEAYGGVEGTPFLDHPAIAWLLQHSETARLELTSLFVSLVSGNYDFGVALIVSDPGYWRTFGGWIEESWETGEHLLLSSRDAPRIGELVAAGNWEGQALGTFLEGLRRLRELDRGRIADLPLEGVG